jgi:hypothetical protein
MNHHGNDGKDYEYAKGRKEDPKPIDDTTG